MKVRVGNIFESKCKTIVNTINCVGVMGKGVALQFKKNYPDMFIDYKLKCDREEVKVGIPYVYHDVSGQDILNFPTKNHWKGKSQLSYVTDGLDWFLKNYERENITSIAFTALGCGNGGMSWDVIGKLMYQTLEALPIEIEIYAPLNTPNSKLSEEYLKSSIDYDQLYEDSASSKSISYNDEWINIARVISIITERNNKLNLGTTVFGDICYVMHHFGLDMNVELSFGRYGVYLKNKNLILQSMQEKKVISLVKVGRSEIVAIDENKLELSKLDESKKVKIVKVANYFDNTYSAKMAHLKTNILYAYDEMKEKSNNVSRTDVLEYFRKKKMEFEEKDFNVFWKE